MLSFDQAGSILDDAVEALPEGIFENLNGGVNLVEEEKLDEDGNHIMGLYHHDGMGRWVEIFYGSFAAVYADAPDGEVAEELRKTLHHELTHHVENKAGDRTLERWDEEQKLLWEMGEPLSAKSVLFADDGGELSAAADALFREAARERGLDAVSGAVRIEQVTAAMLDRYEAVLCMTLEQADALAERFPEYDARILCLGAKDILPPLKRAQRRLKREIRFLADELGMEKVE